jgi:hypothetical protein
MRETSAVSQLPRACTSSKTAKMPAGRLGVMHKAASRSPTGTRPSSANTVRLSLGLGNPCTHAKGKSLVVHTCCKNSRSAVGRRARTPAAHDGRKLNCSGSWMAIRLIQKSYPVAMSHVRIVISRSGFTLVIVE